MRPSMSCRAGTWQTCRRWRRAGRPDRGSAIRTGVEVRRAKLLPLRTTDPNTTHHGLPMDKVFIEGLEIEALIGIYDWERRIRQPLQFDIEMAFDNRRPAASDTIADTLDYKAVSKRLIEFVSQSGFGLVETLAERCASLILNEFAVTHVRLKLSKPGAVRGARAVGVIIERSRAQQASASPSDTASVVVQAARPAPAVREPRVPKKKPASKFQAATCPAYLSLGSNVNAGDNLCK